MGFIKRGGLIFAVFVVCASSTTYAQQSNLLQPGELEHSVKLVGNSNVLNRASELIQKSDFFIKNKCIEVEKNLSEENGVMQYSCFGDDLRIGKKMLSVFGSARGGVQVETSTKNLTSTACASSCVYMRCPPPSGPPSCCQFVNSSWKKC